MNLARFARARFAHAAALAPDEATFRFALGHLHKTEGQLTAAAHELGQALRSAPRETRSAIPGKTGAHALPVAGDWQCKSHDAWERVVTRGRS